MRYIILTLALLFTPTLFFGQVIFDKNDQDYYINYDTNELNLKYENNIIKGLFEELKGSDYYTYIVANGGNIHLVMKKFTDNDFYGIDILKGEYKDVVKGFKKGRKYGKKVEIIFSSLPSSEPKDDFNLMSERQYEKIRKSRIYGKSVKESGFIGIYNIKIIKHSNLNYDDLNVDYFGKVYVTEEGVSIQTDIPTVDLIRGSFNADFSDDPSEGMFYCDINKGYGDYFTISINKESGVGAFTVKNGAYSTTTTYTILE